jgi:hypothetical protein
VGDSRAEYPVVDRVPTATCESWLPVIIPLWLRHFPL